MDRNTLTPPTSLQEVFDRAWQWHIVEQEPPSRTPYDIMEPFGSDTAVCSYPPEFPVCSYRGVLPDGRTVACAIGCQIPDRLYDPAMEGSWINGILAGDPGRFADPRLTDFFSRVSGTDRRGLDFIQRAHDFATAGLDGLEAAYRDAAAELGLTIPGARA